MVELWNICILFKEVVNEQMNGYVDGWREERTRQRMGEVEIDWVH